MSANQPHSVDENDAAAAILEAEIVSGITLSNLMEAADFSLGERMSFALRLANTISTLSKEVL